MKKYILIIDSCYQIGPETWEDSRHAVEFGEDTTIKEIVDTINAKFKFTMTDVKVTEIQPGKEGAE